MKCDVNESNLGLLPKSVTPRRVSFKDEVFLIYHPNLSVTVTKV